MELAVCADVATVGFAGRLTIADVADLINGDEFDSEVMSMSIGLFQWRST